MAKNKVETANPASADDGGAGEIEQDQVQEAAQASADEVVARPAVSGLVAALVLRDCGFGLAGSVVHLDAAEAECGQSQGALDLSAAAVHSAG